jgi:hypothetical protein
MQQSQEWEMNRCCISVSLPLIYAFLTSGLTLKCHKGSDGTIATN